MTRVILLWTCPEEHTLPAIRPLPPSSLLSTGFRSKKERTSLSSYTEDNLSKSTTWFHCKLAKREPKKDYAESPPRASPITSHPSLPNWGPLWFSSAPGWLDLCQLVTLALCVLYKLSHWRHRATSSATAFSSFNAPAAILNAVAPGTRLLREMTGDESFGQFCTVKTWRSYFWLCCLLESWLYR